MLILVCCYGKRRHRAPPNTVDMVWETAVTDSRRWRHATIAASAGVAWAADRKVPFGSIRSWAGMPRRRRRMLLRSSAAPVMAVALHATAPQAQFAVLSATNTGADLMQAMAFALSLTASDSSSRHDESGGSCVQAGFALPALRRRMQHAATVIESPLRAEPIGVT
jgi:hypothetical protein